MLQYRLPYRLLLLTARFIYCLLTLLLLPIFFRRKEDYLTPILAVMAAIFSFLYISATIPEIIDRRRSATLTLSWSDNAKIDGGRHKRICENNIG